MVTYIFGATILLASAIFSCRLLLPVFLLPLSFNRANSEQVYWRAEAWRPLGWNMFLKISFTFISNLATYKGRLIRQFHEAQVMAQGYFLFILKSYAINFVDRQDEMEYEHCGLCVCQFWLKLRSSVLWYMRKYVFQFTNWDDATKVCFADGGETW